MIDVRLRQAIEAYRQRTGERLSYQALADRTGLARSTIESIAARRDYNTSLATIDRLCEALDCTPGDLLKRSEKFQNAPQGAKVNDGAD